MTSEAIEASNTGILVHNVDRPRGLAVDWIHLNLYFIDGLRKTIFIVKMEATKNGMHNAPKWFRKTVLQDSKAEFM